MIAFWRRGFSHFRQISGFIIIDRPALEAIASA